MSQFGRRVVLGLGLVFAMGCGGSQTPETPSEPPPAPPIAEPVVEEPAPVAPEVSHTYYLVYWHGIHVLTVYQGAGIIRSEEPDHPRNVLPERSDYMSAISHYFEHEPEIAELIAQADSLDEFLSLLRESGHEIEEAYLEEGY